MTSGGNTAISYLDVMVGDDTTEHLLQRLPLVQLLLVDGVEERLVHQSRYAPGGGREVEAVLAEMHQIPSQDARQVCLVGVVKSRKVAVLLQSAEATSGKQRLRLDRQGVALVGDKVRKHKDKTTCGRGELLGDQYFSQTNTAVHYRTLIFSFNTPVLAGVTRRASYFTRVLDERCNNCAMMLYTAVPAIPCK